MNYHISEMGKSIVKGSKKLADVDYLVPVLYFAGAAGGLAYGTYALVEHLRSDRVSTGAKAIAKIGAPVLVGSGLAFLGVRDMRAGKPVADVVSASPARIPRKNTVRKGGGRGRGRRSAAV